MTLPAAASLFLLRLADGRVWEAVEFSDGFVCVYHPDEFTLCTIATSVEALLSGRRPNDPLHGAMIIPYEGVDS
ncbi:hypothetical protein ACWEV9_35645 [Streptomyces albogriseolus]|uniref:Uncharacterized protein n=1 Tax=Streptomyces prasinosporus TaxID=68256 RepID=A0ABP6THK2_9ACTN|nr:hypothetical protein GCM10010332_74060 [Streptomyces albogriseolus]